MNRTPAGALAAISAFAAASALSLASPLLGDDGEEFPCPVEQITPNWTPDAEGEWGDTFGLISTSHDGRYVAYSSYTTIGLPNADQMEGHLLQVIVRDTHTGEGELISIAHDPQDGETIAANAHCEWYSDISPNGRYVAFASMATNLTEHDVTGEFWQTYVRDRQEQKTYLVSRSVDGDPANDWGTDTLLGVSNDGKVAFASRASNIHPDQPQNMWAVYVHDIHNNTLELVSRDSEGNPLTQAAFRPTISADGSTVAFMTSATNVVPDLPYPGSQDVYVYELDTGHVEAVSVDSDGNNRPNAGSGSPKLSHDGNRVAFVYFNQTASLDPEFPPGWFEVLYVRDRAANTTTGISRTVDFTGATLNPENSYTISGDGQYIVWETIDRIIKDDKVEEGMYQVYRTNVDTLESDLISRDVWCNAIPEMPDDPWSAISGDGYRVVFNTFYNVTYDDEFDWGRHLYVWTDPDAPAPPNADLNGDGVVDGQDLLILLSAWGACRDECPADLNGDGVVDGADLLILLANWG